MRILITVNPKMYREAISLAFYKHRPDDEIMLAPPETLDGEVEDFSPHLVMRNDTDETTPESPETMVCLIEVLYSDGMDARISMDDRVQEKITDMSLEELLRLVDEAEVLMTEGETS